MSLGSGKHLSCLPSRQLLWDLPHPAGTSALTAAPLGRLPRGASCPSVCPSTCLPSAPTFPTGHCPAAFNAFTLNTVCRSIPPVSTHLHFPRMAPCYKPHATACVSSKRATSTSPPTTQQVHLVHCWLPRPPATPSLSCPLTGHSQNRLTRHFSEWIPAAERRTAVAG